MPDRNIFLSVVIPLYNEAENIPPLLEALQRALADIRHEIVLVDDGSKDSTADIARRYLSNTIRLVELDGNFGQTAALAAGIDMAAGNYIATLDGDMQNDPADIPRMLDLLLARNIDMVTGWRKNRKDSRFFRCMPSLIANHVIRLACGAPIHDSGCTLKVMTAAMARRIEWRGQMHRFIPVLAHMAGGHVEETEVVHHSRRHGISKYGMSRVLKVSGDVVLLWFLRHYRDRPMYGFGRVGLGLLLADAFLVALCLATGHDFDLITATLLLGVQLIALGILAELVLRTGPAKKNYVLKTPDNSLRGVSRL